MNDILKEVDNLKELIIKSEEYKDYNFYLNKLENNKEISSLIKDITNLQKKIVNLKSKSIICDKEEKKLETLYDKLNNDNNYCNYIKSAKKLNELITSVQDKFQDFFDSLVC